jgi:hypothetical protein
LKWGGIEKGNEEEERKRNFSVILGSKRSLGPTLNCSRIKIH